MADLIRPRRLVPGDTVGVAALSGLAKEPLLGLAGTATRPPG